MQISLENASITAITETLTPVNNKYVLPTYITVDGADYTYNNGVISLSNITSDIEIIANAQYKYQLDLAIYDDLVEFKDQIINIILKYRCGYYDPDKWYDIGDVTCYNRRYYVCISNTLGGILPTNTSYWIPLVVNE